MIEVCRTAGEFRPLPSDIGIGDADTIVPLELPESCRRSSSGHFTTETRNRAAAGRIVLGPG